MSARFQNIRNLLNGLRTHLDTTENSHGMALRPRTKKATSALPPDASSDDDVIFVRESKANIKQQIQETNQPINEKHDPLHAESERRLYASQAPSLLFKAPQMFPENAQSSAPKKRKVSEPEVIVLETTPSPAPKKRKQSSPGHQSKSKTLKRKPLPPPPKECIICCEEYPVGSFPESPHLPNGKCKSSVCRACFEQHLENEVETKRWNAVGCPECSQGLEEPEMRQLALQSTYEQWLDKAAKSYNEATEDFRSCPSATCNWGCIFSTKADGNIFTCQLCSIRYCVVCEVIMHEDETCEAYQKRRETQDTAEEERRSETYLKKISKPCPKCGVNIDKISGCDHVTCSRSSCRHEFCWDCFAPFGGSAGISRRGNAAHKRHCKYHTLRLP
ncbi:hypothetical protein KC332_g14996 [Hortaea werneckii]|uniref:RING-type domain-containing protein n=1 Tax=Hortaea werneckii TaxID=91943 RepID=A0A3M7J765_HORWE|nr:hypothetical protein KC350_g16457 [Hortaea werneckii]KAI6803046.1 hypothetical protein KC358_g15028 [Hortaea werneckii]KAI6905215.1 hypothetical protein KC348_g15035 [Hortaea werneckii]KAI6923313.1 hypothetical protein KC341_g14822 [Hortaea werneckii]KAI6956764.1 hypothetical protein KC321_g14970 [Hortaea werneckii]